MYCNIWRLEIVSLFSVLAQSGPLEHFTTDFKMAGMKIGTSKFKVMENIEERDSTPVVGIEIYWSVIHE